MAKKLFYLVAMLFSMSARSQTVITDVSILDVVNSRILYHQSILIQGNKIQSIAPSHLLKIPSNAKIISGSNKFLMAGMIDAHAHPWDGDLYSDDVIDLTKYKPFTQAVEESKTRLGSNYKRFLQCGITSIIAPGSTISTEKISDSLAKQSPMPSLYLAGKLITLCDFGNPHELSPEDEYYDFASSVELARSIVQEQLALHPSLIKILFVPDLTFKHIEDSARIKLPIVKAIIEEAHKAGLKVAVHATERITAQLAVEAGADYLAHGIHDEIVNDDFIQLLKKKHVILCPTSNVEYPRLRAFTQKPGYTEFELLHSDPFVLKTFFDLEDLDTALYHSYKLKWEANRNIRKRDSIRLANLRIMADAGVRIAAGTDVGSLGDLPATSFLPELNKMKLSGMNTWQVLQAATLGPAYILGKENTLGTIAPGKIADMVLLNNNPVAGLESLADIALVFKNGMVIAPDTLLIDTPEMTVQRLWNAYNAKNSAAFLACLDKNVKLYNSSTSLLSAGIREMEKIYSSQLQDTSKSHCEVKSRIASGDTVVDKLIIKESGRILNEQLIVYKIRNQKIESISFLK